MISKITIKNYKKYQEEICFKFADGYNVIIGKNNAGKTTLLKIIHSFLTGKTKEMDSWDTSNSETVPFIEIEHTDGISVLDASKKIWKWTNPIKNHPFGYISAHSSASEIEDSMNNFFQDKISQNSDLMKMIKDEIETFNNSFNNQEIRTTQIIEDFDDYSLIGSLAPTKVAKIKFDNSNPNSIINKGLGQQKEFLLNYFLRKNTFNNTEYLLVDELENSLSITSLKGIVLGLKGEFENKQIIVTTHNQETIGNEKFKNINIIIVGTMPESILLPEPIFCEGPFDRTLFSKIFPGILFIAAGGTTIIDAARSYHATGRPFKAIVDGDDDGLKYRTDILEINRSFLVHRLSRSTVEDYYDEVSKDKICKKLSLPTLSPMENNFINKVKIPDSNNAKKTKARIKKWLCENGELEKSILKSEISYLINT